MDSIKGYRSFQKDIVWPTPRGDVTIRSFCTPEQIRNHTFDSRFQHYDTFRSLYTKRESLEKNAAQPDANVTVALEAKKNIIGYGVLAPPKVAKRWEKLEHGLVMEVKAIEVLRAWRSLGLAGGILRMVLSHPKIEDKIVFLVSYSWTWDLACPKRSVSQYRDKLVRLYAPYGFKEYPTNEPNVALRPENIFMVRIGKNVSQANRERFKWANYGL